MDYVIFCSDLTNTFLFESKANFLLLFTGFLHSLLFHAGEFAARLLLVW
jgi:hypothetical protein